MSALLNSALERTRSTQASASGSYVNQHIERQHPWRILLEHGERKRNLAHNKARIPQRHHNVTVKQWLLKELAFVELWKSKLMLHEVDDRHSQSLVAQNTISVQHTDFHSTKALMREMQQETRVLSDFGKNAAFRVLDLAFSSGGLSTSIREDYPNADIYGLTLPASCGGQAVDSSVRYVADGAEHTNVSILPLQTDRNVWNTKPAKLEFLDITMLNQEFSDITIPHDHPDASRLSLRRPYHDQCFDVVLANGHLPVCDTSNRPEYRQPIATETFRLLAAEIVLALTRLRRDGVLVIFLHPHEFNAWDLFSFVAHIRDISEETKFFKSKVIGIEQSSFYLVARGIDTAHAKCRELVAHWKKVWEWATIGCADDDSYGILATAIEPTKEHVRALVRDKGRYIWRLAGNMIREQDLVLRERLRHIHYQNPGNVPWHLTERYRLEKIGKFYPKSLSDDQVWRRHLGEMPAEEQGRRAEDLRRAEEARRREVLRQAEEARRREVARQAEEARREQVRQAEEARREEARRIAEARRQEDAAEIASWAAMGDTRDGANRW